MHLHPKPSTLGSYTHTFDYFQALIIFWLFAQHSFESDSIDKIRVRERTRSTQSQMIFASVIISSLEAEDPRPMRYGAQVHQRNELG